MITIRAKLNKDNPDIVQQFCDDMNSLSSDVTVQAGSIHLDAKSILALVTLGRPEFDVTLVSADEKEIRKFEEMMRKYA